MIVADYRRQSDLFDPSKFPNLTVTIIGAGGIGGPTALAVAKLGVSKIKVYDFDRVEVHNQPNQIYGIKDIRSAKVNALKYIIKELADVQISAIGKRLTANTQLEGIVIGAVDSMDARRLIWSAVKAAGRRVPLYIDGRLGEQVVRVLTVDPNRPVKSRQYENTIVPNYAVAPLKCTAAGIIDVSFVVAAIITRALRFAVVHKEIIPDLIYDHRNLKFIRG